MLELEIPYEIEINNTKKLLADLSTKKNIF
jgi:hypothetical protein